MRSLWKLISVVLVATLSSIATADTTLEVGDAAPDWSLPGTDGQTHALKELTQEGVVVLAWFPKAFTQGCTIECKNLAEKGHLIREYKVNYFMASADPVDDNAAFGEENGADFVLLSDVSTEVAKAYGVWNERGYPNRHNIYIGTDGTVLAVDRTVDVKTASEDIANRLAELNVAKVENSDADGA